MKTQLSLRTFFQTTKDNEVEKQMAWVTKDAKERERQITDGEPILLRSGSCRPIAVTERAVQVNLACKIRGKRRFKKNFEELHEVLAPGLNILKLSPTTSTIEEQGKAIVTARNSDIATFDTLQEQQSPLKLYADHHGPRNS